ncbi:MAG: copper amine oxidase N-terminal domain-containing protein [Dehalobacterium sp.]
MEQRWFPSGPLAEGLGATVAYDNGEIKVQKDGITIDIKAGSREFKVNGNTRTMPLEPVIIKDTLLIPARSFAETFQAKVDWADNKIIVTTKEVVTLQTDELNLKDAKEKISLAVEQIPDGAPFNWRILADGKERIRIYPEDSFSLAHMDLADIDHDGSTELLLYRYCTGSSGAVQLNIFDPEENWAEIFRGEAAYADEEGRFEVKYLGNKTVSIRDNNAGLAANVAVADDVPEEMLKDISPWVDPAYDYQFVENGTKKDIVTTRRIIGVSHPHTLALLKTTYTLNGGSYELSGHKITDAEGKTIVEAKEPPAITITHETHSEPIGNYKILKTNWDGFSYHGPSFYYLAWHSEPTLLTGLRRPKPGEKFMIDFDEYPLPDHVSVKMAYLTDSFDESLLPVIDVPVKKADGKYEFINPPATASNIATTGRVYSITATWGENSCAYVFAVDGKFDN